MDRYRCWAKPKCAQEDCQTQSFHLLDSLRCFANRCDRSCLLKIALKTFPFPPNLAKSNFVILGHLNFGWTKSFIFDQGRFVFNIDINFVVYPVLAVHIYIYLYVCVINQCKIKHLFYLFHLNFIRNMAKYMHYESLMNVLCIINRSIGFPKVYFCNGLR